MPPTKLAHVVFQTNRLTEMRDWYCAVLGGHVIYENPHLSFVTYDDARATRAVELLRDLAADHQILYLTTSDRYDAVADKVIVLPAPAAAQARR